MCICVPLCELLGLRRHFLFRFIESKSIREDGHKDGNSRNVIAGTEGSEGERDNVPRGYGVLDKIGTAKFPSFFTSESPFTAPYSVGSEAEAAQLIHSAFQAELKSGVLIAVPIPKVIHNDCIQTTFIILQPYGAKNKYLEERQTFFLLLSPTMTVILIHMLCVQL